MKFAWIDVRSTPADQRAAVVDAAIHSRLAGVLSDDADVLAALPPTIAGVFVPGEQATAERVPEQITVTAITDRAGLDRLPPDEDGTTAGWVDVRDDRTLQLACAAAVALPYTVVRFADPTKIPLEIVLAAADRSQGRLVTVCADLEEAGIVLDVLERGSEGVLLAPGSATEVFALARLLAAGSPALELTTLTVDGIEHLGLGDRVCVDTCSHFAADEGILVGSYSNGFLLCCSETHPLPYMPTRPFRVNAGALHSYVLGPDNHTSYLSELRSGGTVLAVNAEGATRRVIVGRAKLESRPLLIITAHAGDGTVVSLTVQDDWHVRVLGPGGKVRNVTELRLGDELLGYLATDQRHVGIPIGEFCKET
ncbi:3-dehydroquinate synthase II [Amycolatopsis ultiminotia]|uniref:3-dehydroquinate synthase II n=1 Tax=Amycolatopsis ultiminotia TaxID=543629 RepID=A0ABP6V341_9PSEU